MKSHSATTRTLALILVLMINSALRATSLTGPDSNQQASDASSPNVKTSLADVTYEQVKPSNSFAQFEQDAFVISYPANWKASADGTSFRIAAAEGASQQLIAYGVAIAIVPSSGSLADDTEALIENLEKSNPGMRALDDPRKIRVGKVRGREVNLAGNSPVQSNGQPLAEHDWLVTLPRPHGDMLYFVFIAPEKDFPQLRSTYEKMLQSVQMK